MATERNVDRRFLSAVETVLTHEGGFVHDPDDPGGATNWGVSLRWLVSIGEIDLDADGFHDFDYDRDGDVDADDIRRMPRADAIQLYHDRIWIPGGYAALPAGAGEKIFDLAVNMGHRQAVRLLQRACRAMGGQLADDGVLGPITRGTVLRLSNQPLLHPIRSEAAGFYRSLAAARPPLDKFLNGWLRRAYA